MFCTNSASSRHRMSILARTHTSCNSRLHKCDPIEDESCPYPSRETGKLRTLHSPKRHQPFTIPSRGNPDQNCNGWFGDRLQLRSESGRLECLSDCTTTDLPLLRRSRSGVNSSRAYACEAPYCVNIEPDTCIREYPVLYISSTGHLLLADPEIAAALVIRCPAFQYSGLGLLNCPRRNQGSDFLIGGTELSILNL